MLIWMFYVIVVSILLGFAAFCAERTALVRAATTRWYWIAAILTSLMLPAVLSTITIEIPTLNNTHKAEDAQLVLKNTTSPYLSPSAWLSGSIVEDYTLENNNDLVKQIWICLSLLLFIALVLSAAQLYWRKGKWKQIELLDTSVLLTQRTGPAVVGLLKPKIVIPNWICDLPADQQEAIIAHEKSHLDARDPLLLTIAISLLVFMPWNFPLWWQLYRLRRAIEIDCDRRVIQKGQKLDGYGETLIAVGARNSGYVGAVAGMAESNSFLETRLKIMISKKTKWWRSITAMMVILSFGFAAIAAQVSPPNVESDAHLEKSIVSLDAFELEKYTGSYEFKDVGIMSVFLRNDKLLTQLTGQPELEIFPKSKSRFFAKVIEVEYTFDFDEVGSVTGLTLYQNGQEISMAKMTDDEAIEFNNALAQKIASQQPNPNSEAAIRKLIGDLRSGEPDYSTMNEAMQKATKEQLPQLMAGGQHLGELQRLEFLKVGNGGWDVFEAYHENGSATWRIKLDESGIIVGALASAGP